jgi:hypothetical protein
MTTEPARIACRRTSSATEPDPDDSLSYSLISSPTCTLGSVEDENLRDSTRSIAQARGRIDTRRHGTNAYLELSRYPSMHKPMVTSQ